jgi:hypothetical protein
VDIGEVKATIQQGNRDIDEGRKLLEKVAADATGIEELARRTINDSQDGDARAGLKRLMAAAHEIELSGRRSKAAVEHANAYLDTLG